MPHITVYTTNNCAYCPQVKKFLTMKGFSYNEVNVETDAARQQEMIQKSGQRSVPVTVIKGENGMEKVVPGFNIGRLVEALA